MWFTLYLFCIERRHCQSCTRLFILPSKEFEQGKTRRSLFWTCCFNVPEENGKMRNSTLSDIFLAFLDSEIFQTSWNFRDKNQIELAFTVVNTCRHVHVIILCFVYTGVICVNLKYIFLYEVWIYKDRYFSKSLCSFLLG